MRRIAALLQKELWQHGWVVALVGAFIGLVQALLLLGAAVGPRTITMLEAHAMFMRIFAPLLAVALGHRLVVREYHARTQLFLEALPVHRAEVLVVKYCAGLAVLGASVALSLACTSAVAIIWEPLTLSWIDAIFVRSEVFVFALWSVLFAMGLLGSWRIPLYLAIGVLLLFLDSGTDVDLARFGPFALLGDTLVLERHTLPWAALGETLLIALVAVGLGSALALVNEGSVAESLAKTMSRREKIAVGVVMCLALIAMEVADPKHDKEPFSFEHDAVVRRDEARLSVLYLEPRHRAQAEALADVLAEDLVGLRRTLGYRGPFGPAHIALRESLAPNERERVELDESDEGFLLRAHFTDPAFDQARFRAHVLELAIESATDGRAALESRAWVRSGTAGLWANRDGDPDLRLAVVWRRDRAARYGALDRFRRTEERFGSDSARAIATSAAFAFAELNGRDAWFRFARSVLAEDPPPGVFSSIAELRDPVRERFARAVAPARFEAAWRATLAHPIALPRAAAWLEVTPEEGDLRTVRWGIRFSAPPPAGAFCALVHAPLGAFDGVIEATDLLREERPCDALAADGERLVGRYSAHDRVFLGVEMEALDARLRLLAERRELR